jgi:hypothetical protein
MTGICRSLIAPNIREQEVRKGCADTIYCKKVEQLVITCRTLGAIENVLVTLMAINRIPITTGKLSTATKTLLLAPLDEMVEVSPSEEKSQRT